MRYDMLDWCVNFPSSSYYEYWTCCISSSPLHFGHLSKNVLFLFAKSPWGQPGMWNPPVSMLLDNIVGRKPLQIILECCYWICFIADGNNIKDRSIVMFWMKYLSIHRFTTILEVYLATNKIQPCPLGSFFEFVTDSYSILWLVHLLKTSRTKILLEHE